MPDNRRPGRPGGPGIPGRPGTGGPARLGDPVRATYRTRGKSYELRPSRDMRNAGRAADQDLAGTLLKLIAVGVAGGIATIAGAKKVGEEIVSMQEEAARQEEARREAYRESVREATANDVDFEYETRHEDPEFEVELEAAEPEENI